MATSKLPPVLEARWKMRVEELRGEFIAHCAEASTGLRDTHGWLVAAEGGIDENRIFQSWCIQKLAMMQLAIEDNGRELEALMENDD